MHNLFNCIYSNVCLSTSMLEYVKMHISFTENKVSPTSAQICDICAEVLPSFPFANRSIVAFHLYLNDCSAMEIKVIYFMLQFDNRCHIKLKASKSFNFENTHYQRETRNIVFAAGVHPFK